MAQPRRRTSRGRRALLVRLCLGVALLLTPAMFPVAAASFTGSTADDGNSIATAEVAAPSALSVVQACSTVSAPLFRDVSPAAAAQGSISISRPATVQQNDLLLAQVANRDDLYTMTAPAGWTLLRQDMHSSTVVTSRLYYKVATSSEPSGYTFTLSESSRQLIGHIVAYSGVSTTNPVDVSNWASGYGSTAATPSVTTTKANTRLVHLTAKRQEALPAPGSTSHRWSALSGGSTSSVGVSAGDESFGGPGATVSRSASAGSFSAEWVAQTVALRPVAGTPSASATWTASPSTWATGYRLERSVGGTVQATQTVTPISATAAPDGPLVNGTTYGYRLWAYSGTWTSPAITATVTPSC